MADFEKVGRNDRCPCGSTRKAKRCCYRTDGVDHVKDENVKIERTFDDWFRSVGFQPERPVYLARFTADAGFAVPMHERAQRLLHLHGKQAHLRFSTLWSRDHDVWSPGLLHISAVCTAESLDNAARFMENRANVMLYAVVVAMNAWCSPVREYAVVDATNGLQWRQARRTPMQQRPMTGRSMRRWQNDLISSFTFSLWSSPHVEKLQYAVQHYVQALDHFRAGASPMCIEHLFIAVEALKSVVLDRHRARVKWSNADYIKNWGLRNKDQIEPAARLNLIFRGDRDTYNGTVNASNSMEHGNTTYALLWDLAEKHYMAAASYVRHAIITACDVTPVVAAKLLSSTYDTPLTDLGHLSDQRLLIQASRSALISGQDPQLFGVERIPRAMIFDHACDMYTFSYAWENIGDSPFDVPDATLAMPE